MISSIPLINMAYVTTNVFTKTTGMYTLHSIVMESTTITNILILCHYCFLCMELLLEIYHWKRTDFSHKTTCEFHSLLLKLIYNYITTTITHSYTLFITHTLKMNLQLLLLKVFPLVPVVLVFSPLKLLPVV